MKITVCIRCQTWRSGGIKLSETNKRSIVELSAYRLIDVEYKNEVCEYCRCGIGDEVSENLLITFKDGNSS